MPCVVTPRVLPSIFCQSVVFSYFEKNAFTHLLQYSLKTPFEIGRDAKC